MGGGRERGVGRGGWGGDRGGGVGGGGAGGRSCLSPRRVSDSTPDLSGVESCCTPEMFSIPDSLWANY